MSKVLAVLKQVNSLRERYYKLYFERKPLLKLINEAEIAEQVYNSNAIENSTLSLEETEKILLQIDLDRYISQRELFEAKNLARVVQYIEEKSYERELDLNFILFLHKLLLANIREDVAGRFRQKYEWVRVGSYIAMDPKLVTESLQKAIIEFKTSTSINIIKRIAKFHLEFEHIHPFVDGNGRIGRVLNNFLLIKEGYVPINIKFVDRARYYEAFQEYDSKGNTKIMEEIVGRSLTNSYHKRLAYLESKQIINLSEYAKKNNLSHSNLLNKAKRQTIEAFLEKGTWKIGI